MAVAGFTVGLARGRRRAREDPVSVGAFGEREGQGSELIFGRDRRKPGEEQQQAYRQLQGNPAVRACKGSLVFA